VSLRIICAPDSFKESMTAAKAAAAMARGIRRAQPDAECVEVPLADGGEGTCRTVVAALGGELVEVAAHDALGRPITAEFGWVAESALAVVEVATAAGLERIAPAERDVRVASTYGVGEVMRAALDAGARRLLIGLGGTATNDAGVGLFSALGVRFLDSGGELLPFGGAALARLASVDLAGLDPRLSEVRIDLASDVTNPLLGPSGASAVFGPQKGADTAAVAELDAALTRWADVVEASLGVNVRDRAGAGAAGGLGAAFLAFARAELVPGVELVGRIVRLAERLAGADYVFTGEGSADSQSLAGKVPHGVAALAASVGVLTVVFAGRVEPGLSSDDVLAYIPISAAETDLPSALVAGERNLEVAAEAVTRHLVAGGDPS